MTRKVLLAGVALLCLALPAAAQAVDEIVARNLQAKGGAVKMKAITTLKQTGTMTMQGGMSAAMTTIAKRPNMNRQEIVMMGQTMIMAFDGTNARMINPMAGPNPIDVPAEQAAMIKDQSDFDGPLLDYKAKGYTVELVGQEQIDGKNAFHLRVTRKTLPPQDLYLDGTTYLETKLATNVPGSGVMEIQFGDYRTVDGMMMPFSVKTYAGGMMLTELKLDTVEVNIKVDDALFKIR